MDAVVIAKLHFVAPIPPADQVDAELEKSVFVIDRVLKGDESIPEDKELKVIYFGKAPAGTRFLVMGADAPRIVWSTPLQLSQRAEDYILQLPDLPQDHRRLEFFQKFLEDEDEMLARDAYDEFAKTPYEGVIALEEKMDREQLLHWIRHPDVPASRRRLYLTMLGICGAPGDADLLETLLRSEDRNEKRGLDALIACYLVLRGPDGMATIEELFLEDLEADYADTYAAIMALRFHGTETDVIPRPRLLKGMRLMLDRPELADLVIPDLARWEDWGSHAAVGDSIRERYRKDNLGTRSRYQFSPRVSPSRSQGSDRPFGRNRSRCREASQHILPIWRWRKYSGTE